MFNQERHDHSVHFTLHRAIVRKEEAAVKLLKCGKSSEQAQLLHETKMMERCVSAHIVLFLGYSKSNGILLLLMEFMPGGTLFKALGEGVEFQWYNRSDGLMLLLQLLAPSSCLLQCLYPDCRCQA